jgi:hypothetical protein
MPKLLETGQDGALPEWKKLSGNHTLNLLFYLQSNSISIQQNFVTL